MTSACASIIEPTSSSLTFRCARCARKHGCASSGKKRRILEVEHGNAGLAELRACYSGAAL